MVMAAEDRLLEWRREFPILSGTTYLISHSMGAMPRQAADWLRRYGEEWNAQGITAWNAWEPYLFEHGNRIGALIGAPAATIAFHQNVSTLVSIALSAIFQPGGRAKIVTTDLNFPSVTYNFSMHERLGLHVQSLQSPDGMTIPLEAWRKAIDDRTLAVVIDHGVFRSGFLQDVQAITAMAHTRGALSIVDAYQTTGCVPYDVRAWNADIVIGGSHKWLCGGPGAAWMYVRQDLIPMLEPRITGWFSHARPFAFDLTLEFAPTAMRFATGTPNIAALYAARAGTEIILQVGVEEIRSKSLRLTQKIIELADARGLDVNTPREPDRRAGMVCVDFPGVEAAERALISRNVLIDYRPRCGLRISPHFYTSDEELDRVFVELDEIRKGR
ncbi:MAG: aminotransferase class V-fold PLP-dependent enzyme [Armatimonadota bacterium]